MDFLQLSLPEKTGTPGTESSTDEKRLRAWLEDLPYTSVIDCAQKINRKLAKLNRRKVNPAQRLALMEQFHLAYQRMHETLTNEQRTQKKQAASVAALEEGKTLRREMAYGYKTAITDSANTKFRLSRNQDTALSAERAIRYIGYGLIQRYQRYEPVDTHAWEDIVSLFQYAEQKDVLDEAISSGGTAPPCTVANTFKPIAFLRISDPYRLPPGTVWDVYQYLCLHQQHIQLQLPQKQEQTAGILVLDMETASTRSDRPSDTQRYWLNGRKLIQALHLDLEKVRHGEPPRDVGFSDQITISETQQLGARLLNLWARPPKRNIPRFAGTGKTRILLGLENICRQLNSTAEDSAVADKSVLCSQINRGNGGLALQCNNSGTELLRVGQLIAIEKQGAGTTTWTPAVIRWVMRPDSDRMQFGIQFVGQASEPISIRVNTDAGTETNLQGLTIDVKHEGRLIHTIICFTGTFANGRVIEMTRNETTETVRCSKLIETLSTLERFSYEFPK